MSKDGDGDEFIGFEADDGIVPKAKEPEAKEPVAPEGDDEPDKEPEPSASDEADGDDADKDGDDESGERKDSDKGRSKPPSRRIAEITAARRQAERERDDALAEIARLRGKAEDGEELKRPDPGDFEFGEADPKYLDKLTDYKVATALRASKDKQAKEAAERASTAEKARIEAVTSELNAQWEEKAAKAVDKYPDFKEKVIESAAAKEWPLLPLSAAAVAASEVGDDIAYHLATNRGDAEKLASIEKDFHEARVALMEDGLSPKAAMRLAKPHLDRATEFFESLEAKVRDKPRAKIATDAPEPARHQVRGAGGKFTPDWAADDADLEELAKQLR